MSESGDELETLMLAAAAADSRQYEESSEECEEEPLPENVQKSPPRTEKIHYYTEPEVPEPQKPNASPPPKKSLKRKLEEDIQPQKFVKVSDTQESGSHAQVVATHYNLIEDKGLDERSKSRIVYMRSFNNWIKSMLINEYLTKIKEGKKQHNAPIRVLDMCCGKGGDLLKWKKGNISHLICTDIAEVSLEHCKQRYADMKQRAQNERGWNAGNIFTMEIIPGDCGKVRIREKYNDPSIKLDLVSCQFAYHYSFESLSQAECMLKNASECLQPGGYFIGTIPDSNEIIARARKSGSSGFSNDILQVTLDFNINDPPLFGAKYDFHLDGVVNCPEFLVHFPTFVKLAKKFGLKLVMKEKFYEFFEKMKEEGKQLLNTMRAMESYPPHETATLAGDLDDYRHAEEFIKKQGNVKIGTLSKSEWEAASLYLTFAFVKVKNTSWNADGTPNYDI
ncbi:mRNA cap guanine-N7 methyltransferase [Anthonomus grandis grandis]|uniref:mRNA cap guanine-N7 methyltransferase n=1 Tax=Anthonomus grandis grandis TaxID=2921223 RepID=UPI0021660E99|nr:mRNA cap guanine-N7 methyltransferase [Anthonomus grandis grandis]